MGMHHITSIQGAGPRTIRYLAYKQPRSGFLGRLGFLDHHFAPASGAILCEIAPGSNRDRVRDDLSDYYQIGTRGAVLTVTVSRNAAKDRIRDERTRVYVSPTDQIIAHQIVPLLYLGESIQIVLPDADAPIESLQAKLAHLAGLLRAHRRDIERPVLLVAEGCDAVASSVSQCYRLRREIAQFMDAGHSVLILLDPRTLSHPQLDPAYSMNLRASATLHFTAAAGAVEPVRTRSHHPDPLLLRLARQFQKLLLPT